MEGLYYNMEDLYPAIENLTNLLAFLFNNERGIITTHESGTDLVVKWTIKDFFTLDALYYYSPHFFFGGERWGLRIYPNGGIRRDSPGHINLVLDKCYSGRSIRQSFSISLKTAQGEIYNEQHGTKEFDDDNSKHEFNRFILREELTRSELLLGDVLTVICTMKGSTSAGSDTDNDPGQTCAGTSTQHVEASVQDVKETTECVEEKNETSA